MTAVPSFSCQNDAGLRARSKLFNEKIPYSCSFSSQNLKLSNECTTNKQEKTGTRALIAPCMLTKSATNFP